MRYLSSSHDHSHLSPALRLGAALSVLTIAACGNTTQTQPQADPPISSQDEALEAGATPEWTDQSGTVHFRAWVSQPGQAAVNDVSVDVGSGYVLVGGGAQTPLQNPPARLTASYPESLTRWRAKSQRPTPHQLYALAIGMRIDGVPPASLKNEMQIVQQQSASSSAPSAAVNVPQGYILVGGGAKTDTAGVGLFLTSSITSFPGLPSWSASAKDHGVLSPGTVTAYAIVVRKCPTGYCLKNTLVTSTGLYGGGYQFASVVPSSPYALSAIGADGRAPGPGRLLTSMYHMQVVQGQQAVAWSTDYDFPQSGNVLVQAVALSKE